MTGVEIRELVDEDIPSLVRMWNNSDSIWPGGFTSGMPLTVERVRAWNRNTTYLAPLTALVEGEVVGFCGLTRAQGQPDVAYISILGVLPEVLGKGIGRDLLRTAIVRATLLGFRRLDLDTWAANTRALPLYKRTGFFWVPGTSVNMQNCLPALLRQPLVRRFLGEEDWYAALRPHITLEEDRYEEGGIPAFPYIFARDGARLVLRVAVTTGDVLAFEDEALSLATEVDSPRVVAGVPTLARWRVGRKRPSEGAQQATLFVQGRGGVSGERTVSATVAESAVFEAELVASAAVDGEGKSDSGEPPGVRAALALGDVALVLGAPLSVVPAVEVSAEPPQISLAPGVPGTFSLVARNNLPTVARVRLQLTAWDDLSIRLADSPDLELAPGSAAAVRIEARAPAGLHTLQALPLVNDLTGRRVPSETGSAEVPIVAGGPADAFAYRTSGGAVLENANLRALVSARGGLVRIQTKSPTHDLVEQRAVVGPPYWPAEFAHRRFAVEVDAREGRASVHLAVEAADRPGLIFRCTLTLTAAPRLETEFSLVNTSAELVEANVRVEHTMRLHSSLIAVPLAEGLLVDSAEAADWEGGANYPDCYAETWASLEREEFTVGFLWPEGSEAEFSRRYGPFFALPRVTAPPGATVPAGRLVLYAGTGGWPTVREQWRLLFAPGAAQLPGRPLRAADVRVAPDPVVFTGEPVAARLHLRHLRQRALAGKAHLSLPPGWRATATEWQFADLRRGQARTFETTIAPLAREPGGRFPDADEATIFLDANLALSRQRLALLSLGHATEPVQVLERPQAGQRTLVIDNGWAKVVIAPDYAASVVAFEHDGRNHLFSAFPRLGELMWQRPWFGGIGPVVGEGGAHFHPIHAGRLHMERVGVEYPVERELWGATWRGSRLMSDLSRPRGSRLEVEYLTLGGSNALLCAVRLLNRTKAPLSLQSFLGCYLQVEGEIQRTVLRYLAAGEHNTRREAHDVWLAPSADWAAVESESTGVTAALVSLTPWAYIQAYDLGLEGAHLFNVGTRVLPPESGDEYLTLFILTDSAEKARRYRAMGWSGSIGAAPEH